MDIKQELKNQIAARIVAAIALIIIWIFVLVYILRRDITHGIQSMQTTDWIIIGLGVLVIAYETYSVLKNRKKLKELD